MKHIIYIIAAVFTLTLVGCMAENYDDPNETDKIPYGNDSLKETNLITIQQLKDTYKSVISSGGMEQIKENTQIKGIVTGNDIEGNIYNQISIQDETGAFIVCISQGGLYGYLPVGQEILIELKGLYVGSYGKQGEIGVPYTNAKGSTYVSRMSRFVWNSHYKITNKVEKSVVTPEVFDQTKFKDVAYMEANCGKLMTIKNVTFKDADGKATFAPKDGSVSLTANAANRALVEFNASNLVVRTSTYADFANMPLPQGKVNITGVFTRFNNTWQILMRSSKDIEQVK